MENGPVTVSLIVPVRNEAGNLPRVLPFIPRIPEFLEFIVVDGHSEDESVLVAKKLLPDAKIVIQKGVGKGDAIVCGTHNARGDYVAVLDSDGSHDPRELGRYLEYIRKGFDLVKGSRYMMGGKTYDETVLRRVLIIGAQLVANTLWGSKFADISYGMFVANRAKLLGLSIQSRRHDVEWELMGKAHRMGLSIIEIPSVEQRRIFGRSNVRILYDGFLIARVVLVEFLARVRRSKATSIGPNIPGARYSNQS